MFIVLYFQTLLVSGLLVSKPRSLLFKSILRNDPFYGQNFYQCSLLRIPFIRPSEDGVIPNYTVWMKILTMFSGVQS